MSNDGTGYVGIDKNYFVGIKEVLNITAETGAWETQTRVKRLQPADVVEVVRCEECKKWHDSHNGDGYGVCDYMTTLAAADTDVETHKSWYCAMSKEEKLQPTDVVEVVRCKNCKHKIVDENGEYNPENIVCYYWQSDGLTENDFCSKGKK